MDASTTVQGEPVPADKGGRSGMHAITVSRLYGSGGGEVAARLAKRLGWQLIDHEVVVLVARALGITQEEAEERDERVEGWIERLVTSMALAYPGFTPNVTIAPEAQAHRYQDALRKVIEAAAAQGQAVIVGRGGQSVLLERRDVLRVFVVAPLEARIRYVARREGLDEAAARRRIEQKERDRERYVQDTYHHQATDPALYDVTINTGVLSLDNAVDLIYQALELKGARLGLSTEQLGPVADVGTYPGRPGDVPVPTDVK